MELKKLKDTADLVHNMVVEKQNALEKMRSRQILVYNNHVFKADPQTITLVSCLLQHHQGEALHVIDSNDNPCQIDDPKDFLAKLISKNQEAVNALHQLHQKFKNKIR